MYLYYDSDNALQETINDVLLHEVDSSNKIYVYSENWPDLTTLAPTSCTMTLKRSDGTYTNVHTAVVSSGQIPYDPNRDLRFFKYNTTYAFFEFDITNGDMTVSGLYFGNPVIVYNSQTAVLNAVTFEVSETSISPDTYITQSQFQYLLEMFDNANAYSTIGMTISDPAHTSGSMNFSYRVGLDCVLFGTFTRSAGAGLGSDTIIATIPSTLMSSAIVGFSKGSDGTDCEVWAVQNGSIIELHCIGAVASVAYRFTLSGKAI